MYHNRTIERKHCICDQKLSQNIQLPNLRKFNYLAKIRRIEILLPNSGNCLDNTRIQQRTDSEYEHSKTGRNTLWFIVLGGLVKKYLYCFDCNQVLWK